MSPPARHPFTVAGWAGVTTLIVTATLFAGEVEGHFGHGLVRIRRWMQSYNLLLGGAHLVALVLFAIGAARLRRWLTLPFLLAAATVIAFITAPWWMGGGPWSATSWQIQLLRVLVFSPVALRTVGCVALVMALLGSTPRSFAVCLLLLIDLALVVYRFVVTPEAVMAIVHPYCTQPLGLLPWLLATSVLVVSRLRG